MSEYEDLHSGSRWEPQPAGRASAVEWRSAAGPYGGPVEETSVAPPGGGRPAGRARRGVLAAAGAGILLIGGIGGYAIGRALAANGDGGNVNPAVVQNGVSGQNGVPGQRGIPGQNGFSGEGFGDGFHDRFHDGGRDGGGSGGVLPGGSGDDGGSDGNA